MVATDRPTSSCSSDPAATQSLVYCYINGSAINFQAGIGMTSPVPMVNHWYHLEVAIDWQAKTFTAKVDGTAIGGGLLEGLPMNGVQRLDIFDANSSSGDVVYWDEIVMLP